MTGDAATPGAPLAVAEGLAAVRDLVHARTDPARERALIAALSDLDATRLDQLCSDQPFIDRVIGTTQDHVGGADNLTDLVALLAGRAGDLGVTGRAGLVHALQASRTGAAGRAAVVGLLTAARGTELTALKNAIDAADDFCDLERLVFEYLDPEGRDTVLAHIAAQAVPLGSSGRREVKVLSDVDDTAVCSLRDTRYPSGTLYPGVLAFWAALDQGPDQLPASVGDLAFLTARPGDGFGLIENRLRSMLRRRGVGPSSVLTGGFAHLFTREAMAAQKLDNIRRYTALYPEYDLVFVGDSGQGDAAVGEALRAGHAAVTAGVFVHDVTGTPPTVRDDWAQRGIWFFDTYVGAAVWARRAGLISLEWLGRIAEAAVADFQTIADWDDADQRLAAWIRLDADLAEAASTP